MKESERTFGKYRGVVSDNQDPMNQGRIRAKVPELLGDLETDWAMPCVPFAGGGSGFYMIPQPATGVWIEFEAGDVSRPVWSGCWWDRDEVPTHSSGEITSPQVKIIRSESGLVIMLDDEHQSLTLGLDGGENLVKLEFQPEQIKIEGAGKIVLDAPTIELGENNQNMAVLGDKLLAYLNLLVTIYDSHIHPGQIAGEVPVTPSPPLPPFPSPTTLLVSNSVKIG
jgi:hypothetical protein